MTTQQPGFSMSQYASSTDLFAAMIARITELESQLAQRFDAVDMATAAAQQGVAYAALPDEGEPWRGHKFKEVQRGCWRCDCGKTIKEVTSDQSTPASGGNYPVMPKRYTVDDDGEELFTAEKMRAFADATCALRASRGQAPAQPGADMFPMSGDEDDSDLGLWQSGETKPTIEGTYLREFDEGQGISEFNEGKWLRDGFFPSDIQDARWRGRTSPKPTPTPQSARQRSDLVPGVMHCAKCKFQLNRVTLCVSDGNAYAGDNKTEPCPNGCGPLWPVTWEQEAKNCWKALEEMHERLMAATALAAAPQPSYTAQAESVQEDAARYRLLRRGQHWSVIDGIGNDLRAEALDAAVDAAIKQGENHDNS